MTRREEKRSFKMSLPLPHSPSRVWRALTDEEEVTRWFCLNTQIGTQVGQRIVWEWDDLGKFDTVLHTWEPGKRLTVLEHKQDPEGKKVVHTIDFQLEDQGTSTLLTLVHSGFGPEAHWDDEFNGISSGWAFELRVLRTYLNFHQGKPRHLNLWRFPSGHSANDSFKRILGPSGFLAKGTLTGKAEGDTYQMVSALGDDFSGQVLINRTPDCFAGVLNQFNQGVLRYEREGNDAFIALETWGDSAHLNAEFESKWKTRIAELLNA